MKWLIGVLSFLFILLQYQFWLPSTGLPNVLHLKKQISLKKLRNYTLKKNNDQIANDIVSLREGLESVETVARSHLGLIRHGETFYQIVKEPVDPWDM